MPPETEHAHAWRVRTLHALVGLLDALMQSVAFQAGADDHHGESDEQLHPVHVPQSRIAGKGDKLLHGLGR